MNDLEKLINIIRTEGAVNNAPSLTVGKMLSGNSCKVGDLTLLRDDLYIAEHLLYKTCYNVEVSSKTTTTTTTKVSGNDASGHSANSTSKSTTTNTDKSKYLEPLKKGDLVLVLPYSDTKYIIIAKLI